MRLIVMPIAQAVLLVLAALAAGWDLRTRTIPNWLTLPALAAGLVLQPLAALAGAATACAVQLPFWLKGLIGGGDVKLMAAAGALLGWKSFLLLFLISSILQGLFALVLLAVRRGKAESLPRGPAFALAVLLMWAGRAL
jgi:prepilin peptidase CpaA